MHDWIANLCMKPNGIDHALLVALHETYSLDDLVRIDELDRVHRSWAIAREANAAARRGDA